MRMFLMKSAVKYAVSLRPPSRNLSHVCPLDSDFRQNDILYILIQLPLNYEPGCL